MARVSTNRAAGIAGPADGIWRAPELEGALFKPRDISLPGHGTGDPGGPRAATAQLSIAQIVREPQSFKLSRKHGLRDRLIAARQRLYANIAALDWAPDLAENIGSARWFRGFGTMLGLGAAAVAFWPDFAPLEAAPAMRIDAGARDEFRSQMILPLALGSDSGRHMGWTKSVVPLQSAPERPQIELAATLVQGDSFGRMLQRAGVGGAEAARVTQMVANAVPLQDIRAGTKVDIVLGRRADADQPRPLDSLSFRARFDLDLALQRRDGQLVLERRPIRVDGTPLRVRGTVGPSLYRSARAAGVPARAVQQYLRALTDQLDSDSGMRPTDTFDIILAYKRAETGEAEAGDLLYAGLERNGKPTAQLLRWGSDGRFFEASGVGETRTGLVRPVNGSVSSNYGMRRHPILGYTRMHAGMDFKASYGTPVHAVADGVVQFAGRHGGHGNFVRLGHGGGLGTGYAHLSRIAVAPGGRVRRGQVIGYVGSTGLSTGPHLHYEMYRNGRTVNPASVNFTVRAQLEGAELQAFRARLAALKQVDPGAALASLAPKVAEPSEPAREIDRLAQPKP
ncbi:MAG: peptidoglycan DD-metalloendopeptidase family protein [Novosphingobium sp.]